MVCFKNIQVKYSLDDNNPFFLTKALRGGRERVVFDHLFFFISFRISHTIRYANVLCSISYFYFRFFSFFLSFLIEPKSLKGKLHFYPTYIRRYTIVQFIFSIMKYLSFPEISLRGQKPGTQYKRQKEKRNTHTKLCIGNQRKKN